jgi:hypothetical protein
MLLLVVARMRVSALTVDFVPGFSISLVSEKRRNLLCTLRGISPISLKSTVPPGFPDLSERLLIHAVEELFFRAKHRELKGLFRDGRAVDRHRKSQ